MDKKIAAFAVGIAVILPLAVNAEISSSTNRTALREQMAARREEVKNQRQELQEERQQLQQLRKQNRDQWCKNVETRIDTRINRYDNNQQALGKVYSNMQTRLERLVERLKSKGADTAKLETDLATLKTKIDKLSADYKTFIDTLEASKDFTCGQSEGQFIGKLGEARKVIMTVRQDRLDIKNFFQSTIRPDLQAIRQKLAENKSDDSSETQLVP